MKLRTIILVMLAMIAAFAADGLGQVATGVQPLGSFAGSPDVINLGNLNAHYAIPVFSRAGRGMPFIFNLNYESSIWTPAGGAWQPDPNWGWVSLPGGQVGFLRSSATTSHCYTLENGIEVPTGTIITWTNFQYTDQWGVAHPFTGTLRTITGTCTGTNISTFTATATDGSGLVYNANFSGGTITTRSGQILTPPYNRVGYQSTNATIQDTNGNEITLAGGSSGDVYTDTLGSAALTLSGTAPSPVTLSYTSNTGSQISVTMNYSSYTVQTAFGCSGVTDYPPTPTNLVSSIEYPDGTHYNFTYEPTPGATGNVTGRIAAVTLPSGGQIQYTYTHNSSGSSGSVECADGAPQVCSAPPPTGSGITIGRAQALSGPQP